MSASQQWDSPGRTDVRGECVFHHSPTVSRTATGGPVLGKCRRRGCPAIGSGEDSRSMKQRLLTPGPTPVPEETLLEMAKPVFYHRSAGFRQLLTEVTEDLKYVFRTKHPVLTLTASGTGGMEASIASTLPP